MYVIHVNFLVLLRTSVLPGAGPSACSILVQGDTYQPSSSSFQLSLEVGNGYIILQTGTSMYFNYVALHPYIS